MSEQDLAALGAADEVVAPQAQDIAVETEGQVETQPAEAEATETAEMSESRKRRERRKAQLAQLEDTARREREAREALERRLTRIEGAAKSVAEPKESDFSDPFEFAAAKGAWRHSQTAAQMQRAELTGEIDERTRAMESVQAAHRQARIAAVQEEIPTARARYADFDEKLSIATRPDIVSPALADLVLESDLAPDLTYHLGANPELARRLSSLPPVAAARELGRIEASLSAPKPKLQSSAPAPISPVNPTGTAAKNPEDMTVQEWAAARAKGWKP